MADKNAHDEDHADHVDHEISQIAEAVRDLTAHDLLKQKFPSRPSERMHMVSIRGSDYHHHGGNDDVNDDGFGV